MKITMPGKIDTDYTIETEHGNIVIPAEVVPETDNIPLDVPLIKKMIAAARHARERAYAPYSKFHVGAAVVMADDPDTKIFTGTNVESAISGLGICAERNAVFSAVSAGFRKIKYVAVATQAEADVLSGRTPCGMCRQLLSEFSLDTETGEGKTLIFIAGSDENIVAEMCDIDRLLPHRYIFKP